MGAGQLCALTILPSLPASRWGQRPGMRLLQVVASTNAVWFATLLQTLPQCTWRDMSCSPLYRALLFQEAFPD